MRATQAGPRVGVGRFGRTALGFGLVMAAVAWAQPGKALAETTCTWAGTPAAPTGTFTINPGVTNFPSAGPLRFAATGPLSGDDKRCRGQASFLGQLDAGSTCLFASFEGTVEGLPGVARWWGKGNLDVPSYLYDKAGNLVGMENAQIVTKDNLPQYSDCTAPGGFTGPATFSSNIVLFN
jgi:hypothetical protein